MTDIIVLQVPRSNCVRGVERWKIPEDVIRKSKFFSRLLDDPALRKKFCKVDRRGRVVVTLTWMIAYCKLVTRRPVPACFRVPCDWINVNKAFRDAIRVGWNKKPVDGQSSLMKHFYDGLEFNM